MKILIACGASGGHIFPALSLAKELEGKNTNVQLLFTITDRLRDIDILKKSGYDFKTVPECQMPSTISLSCVKFTAKVIQSLVKSSRILRSCIPDVVVGFGSYSSGPILFVASFMKIPTIIHEQNVVLGRANRILAKFVDVVAVSFEESRNKLKNEHVVVTGNLIRPDFIEVNREEALRKFGFTDEKFTILVTGGSHGSCKINRVFIDSAAQMEERIREKLQIIHLTGLKDKEFAEAEYGKFKIENQVFHFLHEINYAYRAANLIIARAGAATISEIIACGLPSILIPYPHASGHQMRNAQVLSDADSAVIIEEKKLSPFYLKSCILNLMGDKDKLSRMGRNALGLSRPDAREKLADCVVSLASIPRRNNNRELLSGKKKIHFIGIGGAGMSGIAQILLELGHQVSGSDIKSSSTTEKMKSLGANIFIGHRESNLNHADIAVYSSAITPRNPEMVATRSKNIPIFQRAELLSKLMIDKNTITVTGSHGKTTTSSLIAQILLKAKLDPTIVIGGKLNELNGNARFGKGRYFVAEADESDGSFLNFSPMYSVITNIDREHMDFYKNMEEVINTYRKFFNRTENRGCLFCCRDDENIMRVLDSIDKNFVTFGLSHSSNIYPVNIRMDEGDSTFECIYKGNNLGKIDIRLPGIHNISNSLAAVGVGIELGVNLDIIRDAVYSYPGVERRFEIKGDVENILVIDDYAHHPTEIKATLEAAKSWKDRRIVGIFQPHRYSRTHDLKDYFGLCFSKVDHLIITDIYSANEEPIKGVTAKDIYDKVLESGHRNVNFLPKEEILSHLLKILKSGDIVVVMGAGDIGELSNELVTQLKRRC